MQSGVCNGDNVMMDSGGADIVDGRVRQISADLSSKSTSSSSTTSSSATSGWVVDKASFNPKKVIRFNSLKRGKEEVPVGDRVKLERVLGLTVTSNAALDCDPNSGAIIYPAGCVVVIYNPRRNKQSHILNASKKTITTLAIAPDGRYVATGECGHQPHVRVWDIEERIQVAEFPGHKFGINCVAFSPNLKYVVSIGSQHDMIVNVWDWRNNVKVASNKVSSKVKAVAFSEDGGHFVTVGNRHVKFWYLEYFRSSKYKEPVPLMGRSAILGEQRNNYFCDVACGHGDKAESTFAITKSGLLCEFNNRRLLDKWVALRTTSANSLCVGFNYIFIGCADGIVRCFSPFSLAFITTLPRPHYLGVDVAMGLTISHMGSAPSSAKYPDTVAITIDENNHKVTCIYSDHSMYIWDIRDIKKVGKSHSFLYHSACIWGVEMYPILGEGSQPVFPPGSFITCSSDDTIRVWNLDSNMNQESTVYKRNIYSTDLLKILYVDEGLTYLCDVDRGPGGSSDKVDTTYDSKNGVRCIRINPDGQHLASGDRSGNIRIHELQFMNELLKIEAHDAEVLCLEYSKPDTGQRFLTSASRDRLIHVFDVDQDYRFLQTLDDHSASITAVRFVQNNGQLQMISCGADKSIIFRGAQFVPHFQFARDHHVVGKTTLYDMEVDVMQKHILTACQDRSIRVYNISNGKHNRTFKGSLGEDGTLIKLTFDGSGTYIATSSTDKTLCIYDYTSGECMATMYGHSELVTAFRFSNDGKQLISVSGDGCIFVWKLPAEMTHAIQLRMAQMGSMARIKRESNRRGTFAVPRPLKTPVHLDREDEQFPTAKTEMFDSNANEIDENGMYRFSVGPLPLWAKKQIAEDSDNIAGANRPLSVHQPRGRWAQRIDGQGILVKSIYDAGHVIPFPAHGGPGSMAESDFQKYADIRKEATIVAKQGVEQESEFEPCPESLNQITMTNNDSPEMPGGTINLKRGGNNGVRVRHPTDSSMSSVQVDDLEQEHDGDIADDETDSTEAEGPELIYYPPSEDGFNFENGEFEVCNTNPDELRDAHKKNKRSKAERPSDMPLLLIHGVRSTDSEEDEDSSTPHGSDHNVISMFSVSTESLDRVGQREKFLKNNFESLEGEKSTDDGESYDNRLSISARFLNKSSPIGRNTTSKGKKEHEVPSPRKIELMKQIEETRKKLDTIGWKASLNSSKSISDLTHIPEKDMAGRLMPFNKGNASGDSIRRAASMSDLSKPRRLLPFPPPHVTSKKSDTSGIGSSRVSSSYSSDSSRMSRSSSMSTLVGAGEEDSRGVMRPTISSLNKARLGSGQIEGSSTLPRRSVLPKSASSTNLASTQGNNSSAWRNSEANNNSSSGDSSPTGGISNSSNKLAVSSQRVRSASTDRTSHNVFARPESRSSTLGRPPISGTSRANMSSSRSNSERDLTKVGRESGGERRSSVTAAATTSNVTVMKTSKHEMYLKRSSRTTTTISRKATVVSGSEATIGNDRNESHSNMGLMLEKSPQELPVKDRRLEREDVLTAPLSRKLCDLTADDLKLTADNMLQLYKRVSMDADMSDTDRTDMLNTLSQAVAQTQQTLRPIQPALANIADSSHLDVLTTGRKLSTDAPPTAGTGNGDQIFLLQQYSDMLVNLVQQRMGPPGGSS